jgi:predicted Zn-dependent peptidase
MKLLVSKTKSKLTNFSIVFQAGSVREESVGVPNGTAHFLEHYLFKGTEKRSQFELNRSMAFFGADINAYTSHDMVCYYFSCPTENLEQCVEIFSDMIKNPSFPVSEFEKEKSVILEELQSNLDSNDVVLSNELFSNMYNSFYDKTVIGTREDIQSIQIEHIKQFYNELYKKSNMIVSVVSAEKEDAIKDIVEKYLYTVDDVFERELKYDSKTIKKDLSVKITREEIEQSLCVMAWPCRSNKHKDYYATLIFKTMFGSGMDSILFQSIREDKNLAYHVSASAFTDSSSGMFAINYYTSMPSVAKDAINVEVQKFLKDGCSDEQLQRAKNKIKAHLYGSMEKPSNISYSKVVALLEGVRNKSLDFISKKIDSVTKEDIARVSKDIFSGPTLLVEIVKSE